MNGKQQLGWDAFALDYRVPEALQASVLSPEAMQEYARMSHFSWNLRRVHFVLASLHAKMAHLHKHAHPGMHAALDVVCRAEGAGAIAGVAD